MTLIKNNTDKKSGRVRRNLKKELGNCCWTCGSEGGNDADLQDYDAKQEIIDRERRQQEGAKFEKAEEIAMNLLQEGLSIQIIAKTTGLSIAQIEELKKR